MGRIFFNEDPNHFIFSRKSVGYKRITMADARNFILQYQGTQITDFFVCLNASTVWYDSRKTDNVLDNYERFLAEGRVDEKNVVCSSVGLLKDFYETYGCCLQKVWIEALREIGITPWISVRMNDIHEASAEDSILFSDFFR